MRRQRSGAAWRGVAVATALLVAAHCAATTAQAKPIPRQAYGAAYGHLACQATALLEPNTTEQLAAMLSEQLRAAEALGQTVRVRATHKFFHSTTTFACPGNTTDIYSPGAKSAPPFGPPADRTVGVLLGGMNRTVSSDLEKRQITVQAGMTVKQLFREATKLGLAVPLGAPPAFADLMVGGVMLTGAHGSNFGGKSCLSDIMTDLTWVNAKGEIVRSRRDSPEGRAIVGSLGLLGVVTEMTLQLAPASNTRFDTVWKKSDGSIADDILGMLKETPHMLVVWRPDMNKYNAVRLTEVPLSTPDTGATQTIELPAFVASAMGGTLRAWEEYMRPPRLLDEVMCLVSKEASISHGWASNKRGRVLHAGVGPTNEMQSVSCGEQCAWEADEANLAMWDTHFTTDISNLPAWMEDVKQILEKDFWRANETRGARCMPPGYFWLRFGSGSDDYINPTAGLNGTVNLQMSFMTSKATAPRWGIKHGHILETLEQLTLCKYKGHPHWGKNHHRTFTHPGCPVRGLYPRFQEFLEIKGRLDPKRIFEPPLFSKILAGAPPSYGPRCALSGECFCKEDAHCGQGRKCVASAAFPEYKACRRAGTY